MPRIIHFDIPADDVTRAQKFYQQVFGWEFTKWDGPMDYWMIKTGDEKQPGINGGLSMRMGQSGMTNTIDVPSIEEFSKKIISNGGTMLMPKTAIPGVGWFAQCRDTEGNVFGMMQQDVKAQ
ncbi:MAG TPA: VOC family protein [Nitrosopumilaceae archaeon]|nr:VOC family protein [Nitrosopumilaceae archaeon]